MFFSILATGDNLARSCGNPGEIENGHRQGLSFTFTSKVTYSCDEGFELIGKPARFCQSNGQWSGGQAHCQRKLI